MAEKKQDKTDLNRKLDNMVDEGHRFTYEMEDMSSDAIRYVYGDQHAGKQRKKGWEYPVINRMFADMMQEIAILTANNPRISAQPGEDTDLEVAKACGMVLNAKWIKELNMRIKIIQGIMDDHLFGCKVAKWYHEPDVKWDEDKQRWKGEIRVDIVNPLCFGCDPMVELAVEIPTKARYVFTERYVDKRWAAQRWSKYKKHLQEKGQFDETTGDLTPQGGARSTTDETGFNRTTGAWSGRERSTLSEEDLQARLPDIILGRNKKGESIYQNKGSSSLTKILEIYFKDYTTNKVPAQHEPFPMGEGEAENIFKRDNDPFYYDLSKPIKDEDGNLTDDYEQFAGEWPQREVRASYDRPLYPNGRMVIRLDDDFIVTDKAWDYEVWPFAVSLSYLLPHLWFGPNCVELSRGFQDWMNIIASHMTMYIQKFADPQVWVEKEALVHDPIKKKNVWPNWPGSVVRFVKGALMRGAAKVHEPPNLPPAVFQIFELLRSGDQDLKGIHDVTQGRASTKDNTLGEMQMLNRNSRQRIALQGALLDEWLKQIAAGIVELMHRHLEIHEWISYVGSEPEAVISSRKWTEDMANAKYDIILEPVSTLPYDEEKEIAKYLKAFEITGPAMLEEVLKKMKIQNIPEILKKHEIIGPLMQLMQMAQEMQMGPEQLLAAVQRQLAMMGAVNAPAQGVGMKQSFGGRAVPANIETRREEVMANV